MKLALALLFLCALAGIQAEYAPGMATPFGGLSPGYFFQVVVLQAEAEKLLTKPELTEDQRERILNTLTNCAEAFDACTSLTVPWMQIRCASSQTKLVKNQLKAIEAEVTALPKVKIADHTITA